MDIRRAKLGGGHSAEGCFFLLFLPASRWCPLPRCRTGSGTEGGKARPRGLVPSAACYKTRATAFAFQHLPTPGTVSEDSHASQSASGSLSPCGSELCGLLGSAAVTEMAAPRRSGCIAETTSLLAAFTCPSLISISTGLPLLSLSPLTAALAFMETESCIPKGMKSTLLCVPRVSMGQACRRYHKRSVDRCPRSTRILPSYGPSLCFQALGNGPQRPSGLQPACEVHTMALASGKRAWNRTS